jgi:5,10-methylenetetrahydromethanopterin reductase
VIQLGMTFGHPPNTVDDTVRFTRAAEEAGVAVLGFGDVPSINRETFVTLGLCAKATRTARLGPTVSNPVIRHPLALASGVATVDELSGGRAFLGLATGNSANYNWGLQPARTQVLRDAVGQITTAFDESVAAAQAGPGGGHGPDGPAKTVGLAWPQRRVPVMVAAAGPKAVAVAAEAGDGLIWDGGADPALVTKRVGEVGALREAAGRTGPHEFWVYTKAFVADTTEEARDALAVIVAAAGNDAFRYAMEAKDVPPDLVAPLLEFHARYSFRDHALASSDVNVRLMYELGLDTFLYDRFAIVGDAAEVARRLLVLDSLGVDVVLISGAVPDKMRLIEDLAAVHDILATHSASSAQTARPEAG